MFVRHVWLVCHREWMSGLLAVEGLVLQGDVIDRRGFARLSGRHLHVV